MLTGGIALLLGSGLALGLVELHIVEPIPPAEPDPTVLAAEPSRAVALPRRGTLKILDRPRRGARTLGEVRPGGGFALLREALPGGGGCSRWFRVEPAGYLCKDDARVQLGPPPLPPPPPLRYGVVQAAMAPLFRTGARTPSRVLHKGDGLTLLADASSGLLRTSSRMLVRRADLNLPAPPRLQAQDLSTIAPEQRYRLAFVVPPGGAAETLLQPQGLRLPRYSAVWVDEVQDAGAGLVAVRLEGERGAVASAALRRVLPPQPPADLGPAERWIDVSLAQQTAVAYIGRTPQFATLVSTSQRHTPRGVFPIERKHSTRDMLSLSGARSFYDFRDVPAAQFFVGRIGLHAALWHDRLGEPVSHGCVNLSPDDAQRFFAFTEPALPPGWHTVRPQQSLPATRVVVR